MPGTSPTLHRSRTQSALIKRTHIVEVDEEADTEPAKSKLADSVHLRRSQTSLTLTASKQEVRRGHYGTEKPHSLFQLSTVETPEKLNRDLSIDRVKVGLGWTVMEILI